MSVVNQSIKKYKDSENKKNRNIQATRKREQERKRCREQESERESKRESEKRATEDTVCCQSVKTLADVERLVNKFRSSQRLENVTKKKLWGSCCNI